MNYLGERLHSAYSQCTGLIANKHLLWEHSSNTTTIKPMTNLQHGEIRHLNECVG